MNFKNVKTIYNQEDYGLTLSVDIFEGLTSGTLYVLADDDSDRGGAITLHRDDMAKLRDALNDGIAYIDSVLES